MPLRQPALQSVSVRPLVFHKDSILSDVSKEVFLCGEKGRRRAADMCTLPAPSSACTAAPPTPKLARPSHPRHTLSQQRLLRRRRRRRHKRTAGAAAAARGRGQSSFSSPMSQPRQVYRPCARPPKNNPTPPPLPLALTLVPVRQAGRGLSLLLTGCFGQDRAPSPCSAEFRSPHALSGGSAGAGQHMRAGIRRPGIHGLLVFINIIGQSIKAGLLGLAPFGCDTKMRMEG